MSSKPQHDAQGQPSDSSDRQPLPFEPTKSRKQTRKAELKAASVSSTTPQKSQERRSSKPSKPGQPATASGIPDVVSRRMVKRMAIFCGIPTALGMSTFILSYLIVANDIYKIPTYAVLLVSLGFFGLGVLGLSYGALSASWEEAEASGSRLGWSEFAANWGRMTNAWKSNRQEQRQEQAASKKS